MQHSTFFQNWKPYRVRYTTATNIKYTLQRFKTHRQTAKLKFQPLTKYIPIPKPSSSGSHFPSLSQNCNHQSQNPRSNTHDHSLCSIRTTTRRCARCSYRSIAIRGRCHRAIACGITRPCVCRQRHWVRRHGSRNRGGSSRPVDDRVVTICFFIRGGAGEAGVVGTLEITSILLLLDYVF
jgi:hypothetical protein